MTEHESKELPYRTTDASVKYVVNQPEGPAPGYPVQHGQAPGYPVQHGHQPGVMISSAQPTMHVYGQPGVTMMQPVIMQPANPFPSYKGWSIANLVLGIFFNFMTMCLGIGALVNSTETERNNAMGNYAGAMHSSRTAKNLNIAGTVLLIIGLVIAAIILGIVYGTSATLIRVSQDFSNSNG